MRKRGVRVFRWDLLDDLDGASSSVLGPSTATHVITKSTRHLRLFVEPYYLDYSDLMGRPCNV